MDLPPLPAPLQAVLSRLPQYPPAVALAVLVNLWLGDAVSGGNLPAARGKVVCIRVRDAGLLLLFRVHEEGVAACAGARPDVTITADAGVFVSLALRREDADTLFFGRRLNMEGDTELGLLIRNTLDAAAPGFRLPTPRRVLSAIRLQLRGLP